jgi:hypothetical protein
MNKNVIRNEKNEDYNFKNKNKEDNHTLYLVGKRKEKKKKRLLTTI